MSTSVKIYHNPRCSKSRQTLAILEEKGLSPEVILYLENTPNESDIESILSKLDITARELLRKGESVYKELNLKSTDLSDKFLIEKMTQFPKLIERPIVIVGDKAVLGRPPENVLKII